MLRVYRSNRAEELLASLTELVAKPLASPFLREAIVVQGKGMERWLSMELARRLGVWANPWFPFPRTLLNEVNRLVLGEDAVRSGAAFEPEALLWRIASLLPALEKRPEFASIRSYLERDERGVRRLQLAAQIAAVFDRYVIYRPELVAAWERGKNHGDDPWQSILWRELAGAAPAHLARSVDRLIERLGAERVALPGFSPRVSIFGISTLAPLYLRAFEALSHVLDVHFFLLAPSREFMAGTVTPREEARLREAQLDLFPERELHLERGNPLLDSLGKLGRDFQTMLEELAYVEDGNLFVDPAPDPTSASMLAVIQSDIVRFVDRREGGSDPPIELASAGDDSIRVHSCHSPMREVEVLHDQLLALFDADPTLEPRHVAVMAPSIDEYSPYIEAVFSADRSRPEIPYHVADRGPRIAERVVDAFLRVLELLRGRLTAPQVFDLLGMDVVRSRFDIDAHELDTVREWIARSGIRWGIDEAHREAEGQPPIRENTWRFGLERLLLGFAMPGEGRHLFHGVLPIDGLEGTQGDLLGRLADFGYALFSFRALAEQPRAIAGWETELGRLLERLIAHRADTADQHRRVRRALEALTARAEAAAFAEPIHLEVFLRVLEKEIGESASAVGFLSRGVTFCAMIPMRSIPFRVVSLLGMSDGAFPRTVRPPGFDLTATRPKAGDRTRRDDDRTLFLEALLSARERLLISYVGQSIQDNSTIPPSVVVSELLDTLTQSFFVGEGGVPDTIERRRALARRIVVRHALQSSSDLYFLTLREDPRLFSYSQTALESAEARQAERAKPALFVEGPLRDREDERGRQGKVFLVELDELERFFEHPSRWFCQRRLGLHLGNDVGVLDDTEPLELSALEKWSVGDRMLRRLMEEGDDAAPPFPAIRASGALPPAALGEVAYQEIAPAALRLAAAARALIDGERLDPIAVDLEVAGIRVAGFLRDVWARGQVDWRFSKLGGKYELRLWLRHLLLQLVAPEGVARRTLLVGQEKEEGEGVEASFVPVKAAEKTLAALVGIYRAALESPAPFFPETSRCYARTLAAARGPRSEERALKEARKVFIQRNDDNSKYGDGVDAYVEKLFGKQYAFGDEPRFRELATAVFLPLLEHREPKA